MRDIITTDRLILRPFTMVDATRLCALVGDFDVSKMLSRVAHPYTTEHAKMWLASHSDLRTNGTDFPYAITTQEDGVIGAMGLHATDRLSDHAPGAFELGYWLGKAYWGLGYATEAGLGLIRAYDADLGPKALVSGHFTENPQSGHVLEKLGFHYVGKTSTLFCAARQIDVPDVSLLRPAPISERSPTL